MDRKLAAILAADVVGYSALMERDEKGTFARLKRHRTEVFEPAIKRHHGRVFKRMGDGLLAEFGSAVDAVESAVAVQEEMARRNDGLPQPERIDLRIGVNLGDVIVEGKDLHGEGVNIAARLEQLADHGGVCVSGKVAKEVGKKLAFAFEPMGEHKVKNIAEPIAAYRVRFIGAPATNDISPQAGRSRRKWQVIFAAVLIVLLFAGGAAHWFKPWIPVPKPAVLTETAVLDTKNADAKPAADARPSLAVLPFANMSDDKEQGYLADGISEDLTTELARVPGLFVVSRTAAFNYKGKDTQLPQIAKELGVRYVLEGSIRRAGEDMRINAQLIDTQSGGHVWAERFDGAWGEVFTLQDKVVASVADALKLRLITGQRIANVSGGTTNPAAYDAYLRGLEHEYRNTPQDIAKAVTAYEQAVALDPNFGTALAQLAWVYYNANGLVYSGITLSQDDVNAKLQQYLDAASKHPSPTYYQILSDFLVIRHRQYDEAIAGLEKAIALDPSDPLNYEAMSRALTFSGRAADGLDYIDAAMRVDPGWNNRRRYLAGFAYFCLERFAEARASLKLVDLTTADFWTKFDTLVLRLAADGLDNQTADLPEVRVRIRPLLGDLDLPEISGLMVQGYFAFRNQKDTDRLIDGLRKTGIPELPFALDPNSEDRLTGPEITALTVGHENIGRQLRSNRPTWGRWNEDGTFVGRVGTWDTGLGKTWIEGNVWCFAFAKEGRTCGVYFRNPNGNFEKKNEYFFYQPWTAFEFSITK
jgi:adenylate cyclase